MTIVERIGDSGDPILSCQQDLKTSNRTHQHIGKNPAAVFEFAKAH